MLSNENVLQNLHDRLPYPYTENDAKDYINFILNSDINSTFVFATTVDGEVIGNIGVSQKRKN